MLGAARRGGRGSSHLLVFRDGAKKRNAKHLLHVTHAHHVVAFNHLFAGADAFVSAQLWDVPVELSAYPRPSGAVFAATIRF